MKPAKRLIIILSILGAAALACQSAGDIFSGPTFVPTFVEDAPQTAPTMAVEPAPEQTQVAVPASPDAPENPTPEPSTAAFTDDFSDIDSGWVRILTNDGGSDYTDGGYRIFVLKESHLLWATSGNQFTDVRVQVNARLRGGDSDNNFGLICRYQDENNFYALVVSSDGYYAIRKRVGGGAVETITGDRFQSSNQIRLGEQENSLMAECFGNRLSLYANGVKIAETTDTDLSAGDVGLIAGTFTAASTDIFFDNFIATEIQ